MDIVCPHCNARHTIRVDTLSARPRRLLRYRCSVCNHTFNVDLLRPTESAVPGEPPPRPETGTVARVRVGEGSFAVPDLATLQRWILERRVSSTDQGSTDGVIWAPLGVRAELRLFFAAAERLDRTVANAPEAHMLLARTGTADELTGAAPLASGGETGWLTENRTEFTLPRADGPAPARIDLAAANEVLEAGEAGEDEEPAAEVHHLAFGRAERMQVAAPIAAGPIAAGPIAAGPIAAGPIAAGPIAAAPVPLARPAPAAVPVRMAVPRMAPASVPARARSRIGWWVAAASLGVVVASAFWWREGQEAPEPPSSVHVAPTPAPAEPTPETVEGEEVSPVEVPPLHAPAPPAPAADPAAPTADPAAPTSPAVPRPHATVRPANPPDAGRRATRAAWAQVEKEDWAGAAAGFDALLHDDPGNLFAVYGRAYVDEQTGHVDDALRRYCQVERETTSTYLQREIGGALRRLGRTCGE